MNINLKRKLLVLSAVFCAQLGANDFLIISDPSGPISRVSTAVEKPADERLLPGVLVYPMQSTRMRGERVSLRENRKAEEERISQRGILTFHKTEIPEALREIFLPSRSLTKKKRELRAEKKANWERHRKRHFPHKRNRHGALRRAKHLQDDLPLSRVKRSLPETPKTDEHTWVSSDWDVDRKKSWVERVICWLVGGSWDDRELFK